MDYINFNTKEKYLAFLDALASYCDIVAVLKEDDENVYSEFIELVKPYMLESKWVNRFPGGGGGGKVRKYPLCKDVVSIFKKYDSFLDVGYDYDTELGLDMAFYKNKTLVFNVLRHEDMCNLETKDEPFFKDVMDEYNIKPMDNVWI